jgi:hypothetical protein
MVYYYLNVNIYKDLFNKEEILDAPFLVISFPLVKK